MSWHKKYLCGFTLIEVLVSTLLISFAAILSLSIIRTISQNQIDKGDIARYVVVTKSIRSAFKEYLNAATTAFIANETICCDNPLTASSTCPSLAGGIAKENLVKQICAAEVYLDQSLYKISFTVMQSAPSNGTYFYTSRIRIMDKKTLNFYTATSSEIKFERLSYDQLSNPNWIPIVSGQTPNWNTIDTTQTPNWQ